MAITVVFNNDLTISSVIQERIFQGSHKVNLIEVIAPIQINSNVQISFKLPDNTVLPVRSLTLVEGLNDLGVTLWRYSIESDITEQSGDVELTIYIFGTNGTIQSTGITTLLIEETIAPASGFFNVIDSGVGITSEDLLEIAANQKQFNEYLFSRIEVNDTLVFYVKFTEPVNKGEVIQFAGVQGSHLLAKKAVQAEINANPEYIMGIAFANYNTNKFGYVVEFGTLRNLRTDIFGPEGSILYFDSDGTVPGSMTNLRPTISRQVIIMAAVVNSSSGNNGILQVRVGSVASNGVSIKVQETQPSNQIANDFWYDISEN